MKLPLYQVDAFAESVFKGNPAAVLPLQEWLEPALMQQIAMENNLSETVFFVKNEDATGGLEGSYHIRWFTPEYEIDLCGHATLASAYVIKNFLEPHVQEIHFTTEKAGLLKASAHEGLYTLDFPARMPEPCEAPKGLLESLGISTAVEVLRSRDYFVVLPDEDAVRHVEPDYTIMKELDTIGVIVTAKGRDTDTASRCFYPGAGIPEDPVTGSAHCNIVPYWAQKLGVTKLHCRQLSPRGGDLWCSLDGDRVLMTGKCALFLQGEVHLG
ncbi:MAG: PhzF family phenazine biosynthesis protein [Chitinophagaceae bacterium]|nr:MAG: PhzF family phenazine biosynthesis protein [Chitinophagaceae bacterium]